MADQPNDFSQWLRDRSLARGEEPAAAPPERAGRGPEYWAAVVATVAAAASLVGWFFVPYHPARTLLMIGAGFLSVSAAFVGLYIFAFSFLQAVRLDASRSGTLLVIALLVGGGQSGYELARQWSDSERASQGESVPELSYARSQGWVPRN